MIRSAYEILGVPKNATEEVIRRAYKAIALKCHPDKVKDDLTATARFREATQAYEVLIDPVKRRRYDNLSDTASVTDLFIKHPAGKRVLNVMLPSAKASVVRGNDRIIAVEVPWSFMLSGGELPIVLPSPNGEENTVVVTVPPNAKDVPHCRLKNHGYPGKNGGEQGDLWIILKLKQNGARRK